MTKNISKYFEMIHLHIDSRSTGDRALLYIILLNITTSNTAHIIIGFILLITIIAGWIYTNELQEISKSLEQ